MYEVDPGRFDQMVSEALDGIPEELGVLLSNVAVTVQHEGGTPGLLGLYQGVPLTQRTSNYAGALPDRITIYRHAICQVCDSDSSVRSTPFRQVLERGSGPVEQRSAPEGLPVAEPNTTGERRALVLR